MNNGIKEGSLKDILKRKKVIADVAAIVTKETGINPNELIFKEEEAGKAICYSSQQIGKYQVCLLMPTVVFAHTDKALCHFPAEIFFIRGKASFTLEVNKSTSPITFQEVGREKKITLIGGSSFSLQFKSADFLALIIHKIK